MQELKYHRILLKLGGESLAGASGTGIDAAQAMDIARRLKEVRELGVDVAIVIGAGNLWRGKVGMEMGMDQATADYMGMLGTVMNALALMDALEHQDVCHARDDLHRDENCCRTLHPPPRHPPPGKRPGGHFRRRNRQPLFLHRHRGRPARHGNRSGCADQSHQGGWRL